MRPGIGERLLRFRPEDAVVVDYRIAPQVAERAFGVEVKHDDGKRQRRADDDFDGA